MFRLFFNVLALIGLAASTLTTISLATYSSASCFDGPHVADLSISIPVSHGPIERLTQYANGFRGLENACNLTEYGYPLQSSAYPVFAGEIYGGQAGLCVSAVTVNSGQILSCATAAEVARGVSAPLGTPGSVIQLTRWQPFPTT